MEQRVRARYRIVTPLPAAQAAEVIAGEQSTGTFTRIPGETDELREQHGARVESVTDADNAASIVELSWPLSNMGPSLPNLLAAVAGNLWELKQFTSVPTANPICGRRRPARNGCKLDVRATLRREQMEKHEKSTLRFANKRSLVLSGSENRHTCPG